MEDSDLGSAVLQSPKNLTKMSKQLIKESKKMQFEIQIHEINDEWKSRTFRKKNIEESPSIFLDSSERNIRSDAQSYEYQFKEYRDRLAVLKDKLKERHLTYRKLNETRSLEIKSIEKQFKLLIRQCCEISSNNFLQILELFESEHSKNQQSLKALKKDWKRYLAQIIRKIEEAQECSAASVANLKSQLQTQLMKKSKLIEEVEVRMAAQSGLFFEAIKEEGRQLDSKHQRIEQSITCLRSDLSKRIVEFHRQSSQVREKLLYILQQAKEQRPGVILSEGLTK